MNAEYKRLRAIKAKSLQDGLPASERRPPDSANATPLSDQAYEEERLFHVECDTLEDECGNRPYWLVDAGDPGTPATKGKPLKRYFG